MCSCPTTMYSIDPFLSYLHFHFDAKLGLAKSGLFNPAWEWRRCRDKHPLPTSWTDEAVAVGIAR